MSSLAKQLSQLRETDQTLSKKNDIVAAASLLFHSKVASAVDLEQIHSLAVGAFQRLSVKNEIFGKYSESIMGQRVRKVDRNLLTKKENDDLSDTIKEFLALLSLYLLDEDAQKIMDFLLRNFNVHHYEAETLIISFMHYHSTPFYTRLLQNVVLKTREHYGFLHGIISKGDHVRRETIAKQTVHDSHILTMLIKYNQKVSEITHPKGNQKDEILFSVGKSAQTMKSRVDPSSFLQALLIDLLQFKTNLTETFVASLIETVNHFLKRGDVAAVSFSLIALGSLIVRDKNINHLIIEEFCSFLISKLGVISTSPLGSKPNKKCIEHIIKFIFFAVQRGCVTKFTQAQVSKLSQLYKSDEIFKATFEKLSESYSTLNMFTLLFDSVISGSLKNFEENISFLESFVDLMQTHDYLFNSENSEIRDTLLSQVVFDRFFFGVGESQLNVEISSAVTPFLKKFFLADLVKYLNAKITAKNEEPSRIELLRKFMSENFPGSISFHENVLLKRGVLYEAQGDKKKGAKENREYLQAILAMLNEEKEHKSSTVLDSYLDFLVGTLVMKLNSEQNSKTLRLILELICHPAILSQQDNLEDTKRRDHSKLELLQGFFRFLSAVLKQTSMVTLLKNEILTAFRSLSLRTESANSIHRHWVLSSFFALSQSEDLADSESRKEICSVLKEYLPSIFSEKQTKKHFPFIDLLLSAKPHFSELLSILNTLSKDTLCLQGIANFMSNVFGSQDSLGFEDRTLLEGSLSVVSNIFSDSKQIDFSLLNRQICKFVVRSYSGSQSIPPSFVTVLLNFILNQPQYDTLELLKNEIIDKIPFNHSCLLLARKFMYTDSSASNLDSDSDSSLLTSGSTTLQGNVKALFLINQILKTKIDQVSSELAYQLFSLVLVRLQSAKSQEKQGLFLILENCKKILKKCATDFEAAMFSEIINSNVGQTDAEKVQTTQVKYKILLNLCEVVSKHKVELAVQNPPVGRIIAREILQQQSNKQRDLQSVLHFLISQVTEHAKSEFLVAFMAIFQDVNKYSANQSNPKAQTSQVEPALSIQLLHKLQANSYLLNDVNLLQLYMDLLSSLQDQVLLNENFKILYLEVLSNKIPSVEGRAHRRNLSSIALSTITPDFFEKITFANQQELLNLVFDKLSALNHDGLTDLLLQLPFSQAICGVLINCVETPLVQQNTQAISQKQENTIAYILELLLLKEETLTNNELDLGKLFQLSQAQLITPRLKVLLLKVIKTCEMKLIQLLKISKKNVAKKHKLTQEETAAIDELKATIVGGPDNAAKYIEILKRELKTNSPKESSVDLNALEIVRETADILCVISSANFKRISNILFVALEEMKNIFLSTNDLAELQVPDNSQEDEQLQQQLTKAQVLESKVEFLFDIFAFVAKRLLQHCGYETRNKTMKFTLLHLETVFSLLPYFKEQKTSIVTKIKQLREVYGGDSNLLKVLFISVASSIQNSKASAIILKEMPSVISTLLFEAGDEICCEQLNQFIVFVKGVFVIWTSSYKLQTDESINSLLTPQSSLIAKYLGLSEKRPNTCKVFVRNSLILLHSLFKCPTFKKVLDSKIEKIGSTESVAQIFFTFYYELVRLEYLQKNALSRAKALQDAQLLAPFAKPLKTLMRALTVLHAEFLKLFEIDVFFTICALILDNKHSIAYNIRSAILDIMNGKLDQSTNIKKRHNVAIIRIVHTLHEEIQANLLTIYLANNAQKEAAKKTKKSQKQPQSVGSSEQRNVQRYLQSCIVLFTTALDRKPALFQPESHQIDSAALLETLVQFIPNQEYSFVLKSSLVFLVASLSAQGNKFRVLPHLRDLASETLRQALGLLYFNNKDSFDQLLKVVAAFNSKDSELTSIKEFASEVFNEQNLEQNVFSKAQYFKHSESILKNADSLFTLVVRAIENLIVCLRSLIQPYLPFILLSILSFAEKPSLHVPLTQFLEKLPSLLESRVLLESFLLPLAETCQSLSPQAVELYTFLQEKTFNSIDPDTLDSFLTEIYKKLFASLDYTRKHFINKEIAPSEATDAVEDAQVKAVAALVVKTNEVQLRKFFLNIVTWSERVMPELECGFQFSQYRKIVLFKIVLQLSETMSSLFTSFFSFIIETQIAQLSQFAQIYSSPQSRIDSLIMSDALNRKRKRDDQITPADDQSSVFHILQVKLTQLNLSSLRSCFAHDKDDFIDTARFQALVDPLVSLYDAFYFNAYSDYSAFIDQSLIPAILGLFLLVKEDYKWKTFNYSLMLKTRSENPKVRHAILRTLEKILDSLGERYMVLINDILPFISETLDDLDQDVEKASKALVIKLEEISGESIREYFKAK